MNFYQIHPILVFLTFVWVFYMHGAFISQKLNLNQKGIDNFFINTVLGFCIVVFLLFFIALFHLLYIDFVTFFFLIIPVFYLFKQGKTTHFTLNYIPKGLINNAGLIFIILYLLLPYSYGLFFPETGSDAMRYHLAYAQYYVNNHGLAIDEFLRYPVFSHNMNMAFTLGYLYLGDYQGEVLARMFSLFTYILLIIGLYALAIRSFDKVTAVVAVIILIKVKLFKILMISGYIDIGLTLFLFACIYFLYMWQLEKQDKWLYLSAFMLGIVLGTKYLGLLWLFPMTIWVFFTHKNWKKTYHYFFIALAIGSPWYIRNIFIASNPIHPFLQDIFGYWLWSPTDVIGQKTDLLVRHGVDRSFINFIKLPYLLETHKYFSKFHLGWLMALGIPFLGFALKMPKFFKILALFVFFNLIFWFFTTQVDRYLMPILPLLAIFAAFPFGFLLNIIYNYKWVRNKYFTAATSFILILFSINYLRHKYKVFNAYSSMPSSSYDWELANFKQNKYYVFAQVLNNRKAKRVFNISNAMIENTFNGQVLGDWFGKATRQMIYKQSKSAEEIKSKLKHFQTSYLLVDKKITPYNKVYILLKNEPDVHIVKESEDAILYFIKEALINREVSACH